MMANLDNSHQHRLIYEEVWGIKGRASGNGRETGTESRKENGK